MAAETCQDVKQTLKAVLQLKKNMEKLEINGREHH